MADLNQSPMLEQPAAQSLPESAEAQANPCPLSPDMVAFAMPKRKRDTVKEREARGKGRTGTDIPEVATKKEAVAYMKKLAADVTEAVVTGKSAMPAEYREKYAAMSSGTKAKILSYLGEDIEAARTEFANELLANCREVAQNIMGEYQDYPPSVKTFWFTALADKSAAIGTKAAISAGGSAVSIQVNQFCDGKTDREAIMNSLLGRFAPTPPPAREISVEVQAEPKSA